MPSHAAFGRRIGGPGQRGNPTQTRENVLGGSAVYFSYAASYFTPVRLVGAVGDDWPAEHTSCSSAESTPPGCRSSPAARPSAGGAATRNMNDRETLDVQLNVLGQFEPCCPSLRRCHSSSWPTARRGRS